MHNATTGSPDAFAEIRQIFVSECTDGLDIIEAGLLALERGDDNHETINDIFRGAHSIKGGAATFGYSDIAEFTHVLETLLDKLRSDELSITPDLVQLFLVSVDRLREMVAGMDSGQFNRERVEQTKLELSVWLEHGHEASRDPLGVSLPDDRAGDKIERCWDISFQPKLQFLQNGNQPFHLFRALGSLGEVVLRPQLNGLPLLPDLNAEDMYLAWDIELRGKARREQILEVFDWVESECHIEVNERPGRGPSASASPSTSAAGTPPQVRQEQRKQAKKDSGSIRVDIDKIDVLLNLVGEMVINQAMLSQSTRNWHEKGKTLEIEQGLALLERTTRELQEAVMEIRMLPVSVTFSRFPRLVYDLSGKLKKKVELRITGEQTELDKTVLEKIGDPLLHLIRNSLDHGIETPQERLARGKDETGEVHLSASHEGGSVIIRVADDGAGLDTDRIRQKAIEKGLISPDAVMSDAQIHDLIFHPGFSTAEIITDVSGRGVGMDVVRRNIEDIGGRVEVFSERGKGATFKINLPLTLAILDGQLVRVGRQVYVIPLLSIVETVQLKKARLNVISSGNVVYRLRGEAIPVADIRAICRVPGSEADRNFDDKQLVIVDSERKSIGLVVDELLDQHQVVIKSLEKNFIKVPGMLGATILGDGTVSLILDVSSIGSALAREAAMTAAASTITH